MFQTTKCIERLKSNKKAQSWYLDLFFGILLFSIALVFLFQASYNLKSNHDQISEVMKVQSDLIMKMILSDGIPENWTNDANSLQPGILSNGRINETKLMNFNDESFYNSSLLKFRTRFHYHFHFTNGTDIIKINNIKYFGKQGINETNLYLTQDPLNILKINRFTIYNSSIIKMVMYIWDSRI
jgi:hypothetical protein